MNEQQRNIFKKQCESDVKWESSERFAQLRGSEFLFFFLWVLTLLCDLGIAVKSLIVGTTVYALIFMAVGFIAEFVCVLVLALPKFRFDYTLHVGGALVPIAFALPVIGPLIDVIFYSEPLDSILLVIRILLFGFLFTIWFVSPEGGGGKACRIGFTIAAALVALAAPTLGFLMEEDISALSSFDVRYTYEENEDGTVTLTGYSAVALSGKYLLPAEIRGKEVVALGPNFADNLRGVSSITIPKNILMIAPTAFSNNGDVKEIVVEGTLPDLDFACLGKGISSVRFPNGVSNLAQMIRGTEEPFGELIVRVPDEDFNSSREELFSNGIECGMIGLSSEELYCVNFTTNCGVYLNSVVEESEEKAIAAAKVAIEASENYEYLVEEREYVTDGWFFSPAFGADSAVDSRILRMSGNRLDLYMHWVPVYTLTFERDEWEFSPEPFETQKFSSLDEDFDLPEATREGYTFCGWYEDSAFTDLIERVDTDCGKDLELHGKFLQNYNIIYDWGKASPLPDAQSYYHEEMTVMLPQLSVAGYTFDGWFEEAGFGGFAISSILPGRTGEIHLYAKFTPITYHLTFAEDGGTSVNEKTYTIEDGNFDLSSFVTTRKGFDFDGWYDEKGTLVTQWNAEKMKDETLTAHWKLASFNVKLTEGKFSSTYGGTVMLEADCTETGGWFVTDPELQYSYRWLKQAGEEWNPVESATQSSLILRSVAESGSYRLEVTATYTKDRTTLLGGAEETEKAVVISPKVVTVTWQAPANLVYNKQAKAPTVQVGGLEQNDVCTATTELASGNNVNVGTFTYRVQSLNNMNYTIEGAENVTSPQYEIAPKKVSILWTQPESLMHDGNPKIPTVQIINLEPEDVCTAVIQLTPGKNNVDEGTFTYEIIGLDGKDSGNYQLPDEGERMSPEYTITSVLAAAAVRIDLALPITEDKD